MKGLVKEKTGKTEMRMEKTMRMNSTRKSLTL